MGINGMMAAITTAGLVKTVGPVNFAGKKLSMDVSIGVHASVSIKGMSYITYFIKQNEFLRQHNITPIYVFDGPPKKNKAETLTKRAEQAKTTKTIRPTFDHFEVLKTIFTHHGIEWLQAKEETDPLCSELFHRGDVVGAFTRDTDFLTYGIEIMITKIDRAKKTFEVVFLKDVLAHFQLDYPAFVDYCILLGTDYNKNISGIASARAMELIRKFGSIKKYVEDTALLIPFDHEKICRRFTKRKTVEERCGEKKILDIKSDDFKKLLEKTLSTNFAPEKLEAQVRYALSIPIFKAMVYDAL